jgi:dolichyl-phosphate-mannose-protein mannosyltransferase
MPVTTFSQPASATWTDAPSRPLAIPRLSRGVVVVALAFVALTFRVSALSTYGFSEDEINKLRAIDAYRTGDFRANAEHPMLMKLAMWGSVTVVDAWNHVAPADRSVSLEAAIRAPNAIAGAATTAAMFGVADVLFGTPVAIVAASIWAFDVNAIATNRIGKEDTFLLLFFLIAVWCYERAKQIGAIDLPRAQRWYTASGAAFGVMLASKYMPQYLGIYALFNLLTDLEPGANKPDRLRYYGAMCAAFLATNPIVVLPETWRYVASYVHGDLLVHHGYLYDGALYVTNVPVSPLGVPATYYLRLLATKVPLVVLAGAVPGAIEMVRRRGTRGFHLLRLLAILFLVPYSLMAAKFLRYALPMIATLDLIAAVGVVSGIGWLLRKRWLSMVTRVAVATAALIVFAAGLVSAQQTAAPFYSRFENGIGERIDPHGSAFPEQTYDYGVREAAAEIASVAPPFSRVVTDAGGVAAEYLRRERPDLVVRSLSADGVIATAADTFVIVQDEHLTFENALVVRQLRAMRQPWREIRMADVVAVQVFRMPALRGPQGRPEPCRGAGR